jgi:hypothetical protein
VLRAGDTVTEPDLRLVHQGIFECNQFLLIAEELARDPEVQGWRTKVQELTRDLEPLTTCVRDLSIGIGEYLRYRNGRWPPSWQRGLLACRLRKRREPDAQRPDLPACLPDRLSTDGGCRPCRGAPIPGIDGRCHRCPSRRLPLASGDPRRAGGADARLSEVGAGGARAERTDHAGGRIHGLGGGEGPRLAARSSRRVPRAGRGAGRRAGGGGGFRLPLTPGGHQRPGLRRDAEFHASPADRRLARPPGLSTGAEHDGDPGARLPAPAGSTTRRWRPAKRGKTAS